MNDFRSIVCACFAAAFSFALVAADNPSPTKTEGALNSKSKEIDRLREAAGEFFNRGDYARALQTMKQAVKECEGAFGADHTNVASLLDLTAGICRTQGDFSNAVALCERSLAVREKALGPEHSEVANSLFALAALHNDLGNYAMARRPA